MRWLEEVLQMFAFMYKSTLVLQNPAEIKVSNEHIYSSHSNTDL